MNHDDLIGLQANVARDMCMNNDVRVRVSRIDDSPMIVTADYVIGRVNLHLETDGKGGQIVIGYSFG